MKLFKGQIKAVERLFEEYEVGTRIVDFKAPTGSGKTFMSASFISEVIRTQKPNEKVVFVIATVSSSELPKQFEIKLKEYQKYLDSKFTIERVESPSSSAKMPKDYEPKIVAENNKVLIFGKSSFGKNKILTERGAFEQFIDQIKSEGFKMIYIRDEAHIGADEKILSNDNEEQMLHNSADFVIRMTATPQPKNKQIVVKEVDLRDDTHSLLKTKDVFNLGIKQSGKSEIDSYDLLEIAIKEFKDIKKQYASVGINPAMLIQITSQSKNVSEQEIEIAVEKYKEIINKKHGLQWATYYGGSSGDKKDSSVSEKMDLNSLSSSTSPIDVIIFKVGPATGWDIPRACMLVQLREVYSETLNQQTVGRIKRNPIRGLEIKDFADKYYIYSNYQEPSREMFLYTIKDKFKDVDIPVIKAIEKKEENRIVLSDFEKLLVSKLTSLKPDIMKFVIDEFSTNPSRVAFRRNRYIDSTTKEAQKLGERYVYNALQLKIELNKFFNADSDTFKQYNLMFSSFEISFASIKSDYNKITFEQYLFAIIHYWGEISEFYKKNFSDKVAFEYKIVNGSHLKDSYVIWGNKSKSGSADSKLLDFEKVNETYAYLNSDNTMLYKQALDSNPEAIFMESVINYLRSNPNNKFDMWAKNPSLGNDVFLEYKNSVGSTSKAFIDFVFKKGDQVIYVEVKGHKDYDKDKTDSIIEAFNEYKKLPDERVKNIFFALVVVNTDDYDKEDSFGRFNFVMHFKGPDIDMKFNRSEFTVKEFFDVLLVNSK